MKEFITLFLECLINPAGLPSEILGKYMKESLTEYLNKSVGKKCWIVSRSISIWISSGNKKRNFLKNRVLISVRFSKITPREISEIRFRKNCEGNSGEVRMNHRKVFVKYWKEICAKFSWGILGQNSERKIFQWNPRKTTFSKYFLDLDSRKSSRSYFWRSPWEIYRRIWKNPWRNTQGNVWNVGK